MSRLLFLVLVAAVAFVAGVLANTRPAAQPESLAPAGSLSAVAISEKVGSAVVSVRADQEIGSGMIFDANGLILTNAHVVSGTHTITITLKDGRHFAGTVIGSDTAFDIAVIGIDAGSNLPTVALGTASTLKVGEPLVVIGNPYGLNQTLTTGIVSALDRPVSEGQGTYYQPMIQTNADINPGNSGGPLLDMDGRVIGVATLLIEVSNGAPAQGLSFAVPIDTARRVANQLVQYGQVVDSELPYMGMSLADLKILSASAYLPNQPPVSSVPGTTTTSPAASSAPSASADRGALVARVVNAGPAADAGIQAGDVITSFAGAEIYNRDELLQHLVVQHPGDVIPVAVSRAGQTMSLSLTLTESRAP
jgi:S1-C subfamily serine protease